MEGGIESLQALIDKTAHLHDETDLVVRDARVATQVDLPEAIGFIRSSTRKMDALITAILKLAREGRRQLNIEPIDLRQAVAQASRTSSTSYRMPGNGCRRNRGEGGYGGPPLA